MNFLYLAILGAIFLVILWLPACSVAFLLRGMHVPKPFSGLCLIWIAQLIVAVGLIYLANALGFGHPGYTLGIAVITSVVGAVVLWHWRRPQS